METAYGKNNPVLGNPEMFRSLSFRECPSIHVINPRAFRRQVRFASSGGNTGRHVLCGVRWEELILGTGQV
jgi:hypothetical protein